MMLLQHYINTDGQKILGNYKVCIGNMQKRSACCSSTKDLISGEEMYVGKRCWKPNRYSMVFDVGDTQISVPQTWNVLLNYTFDIALITQ